MLEIFLKPETWTALVSLTAMEVVLGLDNLVFISVLTARLPAEQRRLVTRIGVGMALVLRIGLLFTISWIMRLTYVLFHIGSHGFTARHLILAMGGLFLMGKATTEIHKKVEHRDEEEGPKKQSSQALGAILQIIAIVVAMVVAVCSMMFFAGSIGAFIEKHPSMKILALSFLLLIGALLVAESLGQHVSKGYIYFAMAFSVLVELLNLRFRSKEAKKVESPA